MKLPWRRTTSASRGQALIEFALILPILLLILLLAVDFGRVFFGWVALNNATRIGANEAAKNPDAWPSGDAGYYLKVARDLEPINCDADTNNDGVIDAADLPDPVFTERADDPLNPYQAGDLVSVTLTCGFSPITPLVGGLIGDPLAISATSTFLVFGGTISGVPVPPNPVPAGCIGADKAVPAMVGLSVAQARAAWTAAGFTGAFTPPTGPTDVNIVLTQTTTPTSSPGGCLPYFSTVSVASQAPATCSGTDKSVPSLVSLTVSAARTAWTGAGFTGGFTPLTGSNTDIVSGQVTSTGATPGACSAPNTSVTVTHAPPPLPAGYCLMPQVIGLHPATAESAWRTEGFATGAFKILGNSNDPTLVVKSQSLVGGQPYLCASSLTVQVEKNP